MDPMDVIRVGHEAWLEIQPTVVMIRCQGCGQLRQAGTTADQKPFGNLCLDCYVAKLETIEGECRDDPFERMERDPFGPEVYSESGVWAMNEAAWQREHDGEWDNYVPDEDDGERHVEMPEAL